MKSSARFEGESGTHADFQAKQGERYAISKPHSAEIWRRDGRLEDKSVTKQDYDEKRGERYQVKKPGRRF